jgi:hypothetical protein
MDTPYEPPAFQKSAFNCVHCSAFAAMFWSASYFPNNPGEGPSGFEPIYRARCTHCQGFSVWVDERLVHPDQATVPPPNRDLDQDIQDDYLEARGIVDRSARGAAALLRLALQKICKQLGQPGKNINADIAALVKAGTLPQRVQQALDVVRVVGNNAVHPGQIDLKDDRDAAVSLFALVNLIADVAITQPKEIEELYNALPESTRAEIERRDQ